MKKKFIFLFLFVLSFGYLKSNAQLAGGTYTINSALPTGGVNYASFSAAVTAMASGITGPVVFNVTAGSGPYVEQVTIGNITGASATNTIKFNGNGATVQYTSTATYTGVFMLNGAKYVKIDSLTIKALSTTYGYGAFFYNACDYDSLTRCIIDVSASTSTSSVNGYGLKVTSTASGTSTTVSGATNSYFGSNKIMASALGGGCYYGIYNYGPNNNNVFEKNDITNMYYYGINNSYSVNNKIINNTISRATKVGAYSYFYAIYNNYAKDGTKIIGNRIYALDGTGYTYSYAYFYCIYNYYSAGTATNPIIIANNLVYNTPVAYGIYSYTYTGGDYTNIYHNTVSIDNTYATFSSTNYGMYIYYPPATMNIRNNNISITGGSGASSKYGLYFYPAALGPVERNNIYVNTTGTQYYAYYNSTTYATFANFTAANPTVQAGAVSVNPQYASIGTGNLSPTNTAMFANGVNVQSVVPTDIVGQPRLAAPAPGAFEFQANGTNNAGMVALTSPLGNYCPGSSSVKASIYNAGTNNITSVTVNWSLNGVVQTPVAYTQTLVPLTSATGNPVGTLTLGNATLAANVPVALKIWTSNPNGSPDLLNTNDTLYSTLTALSLAVDAYKDTVCINRGAAITLAPSSGFNTGALLWQRSVNSGASWDSIPNSDITNYATPNLTGNTWFRVKMTSGTNTCYSDTAYIYTTNPQITSHTPDTSRCGAGPVTLNAANSANSQIKWFNSPSSFDPIATGSQFVTPYLGATTSFWVSAGIPNAQPTPINVISGTSTTTTGSYMPFYYGTAKAKVQYIITASELLAQGYSAGNINSIGLQLTTVGTPVIDGASISMGATTANVMTTFVGGLQTVYSAATYTLVANATNYFDFQTPYYWDGVSNVIISFCKNGTAGGSSNTYSCKYGTDNKTTYATSTTDICASTTGASAFSYRANILLKMTSACEAPKQKIDVIVYPNPIVDLGVDINNCVNEGDGVVLDAGLQPNIGQYHWDDNTISQIRAVFQTGTYSVKVTNQFNCSNSDTINVVLRKNPVVNLGNDTVVCNGVSLPLDAGGDGIQYFWSNGLTSREVNVTSAGMYIAFVTNSAGCVTIDTINVTMQGELPSVQNIQVSNNGQFTFHFTAVNPQNVIGYSWDFGDGSAPSYEVAPTHTYPDAGNYTVVLHLSSTCGFISDTLSAHIVGIHQINVSNDALNVYPNPTRDMATVAVDGTLKMEKLEIYNVIGQVVYKATAQSQSKHVISLTNMASGIYTIQVYTDKGTVSRKIEVLK